MESSHFKIILIAIYAFLVFSCSDKTGEALSIPVEASLFEDGDIICRLGNGMFSNLFSMHSKEHLYSHVGIIHTLDDGLYVIHADANELTGIGSSRQESLENFLGDSRRWGIYRLQSDAEIRNRIVANALYYVNNRTPFDMNFDLTDDKKVYCTQLVAIAINKATGETLITPGYSLKGRPFYIVDDIYLHPGFECIFRTEK